MGGSLMDAYYVYSSLLALKLLALVPMAHMSACNREKITRANLSDLKHLSPFWLVCGLYVTTDPDHSLALTLMRIFVAARVAAALGYVTRVPRMVMEGAFFISFIISFYMGAAVVYKYKNCL